jgi:hypothetical protein
MPVQRRKCGFSTGRFRTINREFKVSEFPSKMQDYFVATNEYYLCTRFSQLCHLKFCQFAFEPPIHYSISEVLLVRRINGFPRRTCPERTIPQHHSSRVKFGKISGEINYI